MDFDWTVALRDLGPSAVAVLAIMTGRLVPWFTVNRERGLLERLAKIHEDSARDALATNEVYSEQMRELTKAIYASLERDPPILDNTRVKHSRERA